jgi:hypothetical protein
MQGDFLRKTLTRSELPPDAGAVKGLAIGGNSDILVVMARGSARQTADKLERGSRWENGTSS